MKRSQTRNLSISRLERSAETLRVLAHPVRLKLIELLARGCFSVGELAARVKQKPHVVSEHLNQMRMHGLLTRQRIGRSVFYQIDSPIAIGLLRCIGQQETPHAAVSPGGESI